MFLSDAKTLERESSGMATDKHEHEHDLEPEGPPTPEQELHAPHGSPTTGSLLSSPTKSSDGAPSPLLHAASPTTSANEELLEPLRHALHVSREFICNVSRRNEAELDAALRELQAREHARSAKSGCSLRKQGWEEGSRAAQLRSRLRAPVVGRYLPSAARSLPCSARARDP